MSMPITIDLQQPLRVQGCNGKYLFGLNIGEILRPVKRIPFHSRSCIAADIGKGLAGQRLAHERHMEVLLSCLAVNH